MSSAGGITAEPPVKAAPSPTADPGRLGRWLANAVFLTPALLLLVVWMLYPVVGVLAVGTGLAIPSLTALISRHVSGHEQGKVMGGQQAILSLTLILGPVIAGLAFDHLGVSAPYWIGGFLAVLALLVAAASLLPEHRNNLTGRYVAGKIFRGENTVRKPPEPGA